MWNVVAEGMSIGRSKPEGISAEAGNRRLAGGGGAGRVQTYELSPNSLRGVSKHQAGWVTRAPAWMGSRTHWTWKPLSALGARFLI